MQKTLNKSIIELVDYLHDNGCTCYVAGGAVRDFYLNVAPRDIDIEVHGILFDDLAELLNQKYKTQVIGKFAIIKVLDIDELDVAVPRQEIKDGDKHTDFIVKYDHEISTYEACIRRDFTINSMLYNLKTSELVDHFGGLDDLNNQVIRHVSDKFSEDPLRALRAIKFATRMGFSIAPETQALIKQMDLSHLSTTRIVNEFVLMMEGKNVHQVITLIGDICPELFGIKPQTNATFSRFIKGDYLANTLIMLYLYSMYQEVNHHVSVSNKTTKQLESGLVVLNFSENYHNTNKERLFNILEVYDNEQYLINIVLSALQKCEFKEYIMDKHKLYVEGMEKYTGKYFLQKDVKGPEIKQKQKQAIIDML